MTSRRAFLTSIGGLLAGCSRLRMEAAPGALLEARPRDVAKPCEPGTHSLKLRAQRDTLLYVPKSAAADKPAPLILYLHGATGDEQQGIRRMGALADESGFLLLSPASAERTWDAIRGGYGPDLRLLDQSLARAFAMRRVDPSRIAIAGFSDGASYALGVGLSNGDLFHAVMAFSPCFVPPGAGVQGKPRLFLSHGTNDEILPIASCSRRLAPELQRVGYDITFRQFEGPHTVPPDIARDAVRWFLA